jgi:hypothetical protein
MTEELEAKKMAKSSTVTEALDRIRRAVDGLKAGDGADGIEYPRLAVESAEHVLVFGSVDSVTLVGARGKTPYFASEGYLTDFSGRKIEGSQIQAALPVDPNALLETIKWPPAQPKPFDKPPVKDANTTGVGFAKNSFSFGRGDSIVTVGATLPKVLLLPGGGAMFWVTSCQAISQGTGRYEGARGIQAFTGSSYFSEWPSTPEGQIELLSRPFEAKIQRSIKVVLKGGHV